MENFINILKDPIEHVKELVQPIPTKLNNISTKIMLNAGLYIIKKLTVIRTPLKQHWKAAIDAISLGQLDELQKKYGFDKLFHLALLAEVQKSDGSTENVKIEKNETVDIVPFVQERDINNESELMEIIPRHQTTLNQLIENTLKFMGPNKFYEYNAFGTGDRGSVNNCQVFIRDILKSNGLLTAQANKFIYQNIEQITKDLNSSKFSYVPKVIHNITRIGSHLSRLIGKGTKKNKTMIGGAEINPKMVNFINNGGFGFI